MTLIKKALAVVCVLSLMLTALSGCSGGLSQGKVSVLSEQASDEGFDEIPEELLETEEDIEKDKADEEKMKKFDKVYNILLIIFGVLFVALLIYNIFFK